MGSIRAGLLLAVLASGCAGSEAPPATARPAPDFGNADDSSELTQGIGRDPNWSEPGGQAGHSAPAGDGGFDSGECAREVTKAENRPLTIYTLFDDSGSMIPWWIPVTQAFIKFVQDPRSEGINVGLKFFGSECAADSYATPDVLVGPVGPGSDQAMALEGMLGFHLPVAGTATLPAVEGGLMAAREHAEANVDEAVILLLVTDGAPNDCDSTVDNVAEAARAGFSGAPSIPMYVLGLGDIEGLNALGQAGGTGDALMADPNMADQVVAAMNAIRGRALPCDYALPGGAEAGTDLVNLEHTPADGEAAITVPNVRSAEACDPNAGGWYYNADGTRLLACAQTCDRFKASVGGRVDVVLGCPTVVLQ